MGNSTEERFQKKIEEYRKLQRVCGYCDHFPKLGPGSSLMEKLVSSAIQLTYQTGKSLCSYHQKMVNFTDYCPNYHQDEFEFCLMLSMKIDSEEKLDEEIRYIKEMRRRHK